MKTKILVLAIALSSFVTYSQTEFITTWKTDNPGLTGDTEITIQTLPGGTYNYDVDWTYDGVTFIADDSGVTGNIIHDYGVGNEGTYTVAIRGTFPQIFIDDDIDRLKILTVEQWGTNAWLSMENAFDGCDNLEVVATDLPNFSNCTSLSAMFANCFSLVGNATFNSWDVSNITDFSSMFNDCLLFDQDLSNWDVGNGLDMGSMFDSALVFNQDIGNWNVENVTDMNSMFDEASSFNQDINSWDVGNVLDMEVMFRNALAFNQDIGNWNVGNVLDMEVMFKNALAFNQDIGGWNVSKVEDMMGMFDGAIAFDQNLESWDLSSIVNDESDPDPIFHSGMQNMFLGVTLSIANYDATLIGWATDSSGVLADGIDDIPTGITFHGGSSTYCNGANARNDLDTTHTWTFTADGGLACSTSNYFVTTWKTDNTGSSSDTEITIPTFPGGTYNYDVDWTYDGATFNADDSNVTSDITHDYTVIGTYTVAIRGTFPRIYFNNSGDKEKILTLEQWGTNPWSSMEGAFYGCENLNITNGSIDNPDLSNVNSLKNMFRDCSLFNGDVTGWDVSTIISMESTFEAALVFNQDISGWDVSNVTTMFGMFFDASIFDQDISGWDVSNVTNMSYIFGYTDFNQDINSWDVSNVTTMANMFYYAREFDQNINSWDVSMVEDMDEMFLESVVFNQDLNSWDVSNVTSMHNMFAYAEAFNGNISAWDVSKVTDFSHMFDNEAVFNQDLGNWDIGNVTDMSGMFLGVTLSTANYDATLIGWATDSSGVPADGIDDIPTGITFHGGNSTYCNSEAARNLLIAPLPTPTGYGWAITDAGKDCTTLGIDNYNLNNVLSLHPNPSSDVFYIKGLKENANVTIYDINGRLLLQQDNYLDTPIDVTYLDATVYFVIIKNTKGKSTKRLVKQ